MVIMAVLRSSHIGRPNVMIPARLHAWEVRETTVVVGPAGAEACVRQGEM